MAITAEQRERIRQGWFLLDATERSVAEFAGVAKETARRHRPSDAEIAQHRADKKASIEAQVTAELRDLVLTARRKFVLEMSKDDKLREASVQQLATSYGIMTDKFLLEDGKATERIEHSLDWRAKVEQLARERGLDPAEIIAATEATLAEQYGLAD